MSLGSDHTYDYVLVGGGLQNGLIALALRTRQPTVRIAMVERGAAIGGNHTWCFHAGDIDDDRASWIEPLVVTRWAGYDVAFPGHARRLDSTYACVTSERLASVVAQSLSAPGSRLLLGASAREVHRDRVCIQMASGDEYVLNGTIVIDARGPDTRNENATGWQKFLGQELVLSSEHGLDRPMLMDATVPQLDGFRFVYVLPLGSKRILVEDTYFSDRPYLDVATLRERIASHVADRGWTIQSVAREEVGVLPLPLECDPLQTAPPLVAGYAGGWFHPVTGYSFPIASRLASFVAAHSPHELFGPGLDAHARRHSLQLRFALRLNRMLFKWFAPHHRFHVLERFYRLPEEVIRRFYALELTRLDRARIMFGRPPRGLSIRGMLGLEVA